MHCKSADGATRLWSVSTLSTVKMKRLALAMAAASIIIACREEEREEEEERAQIKRKTWQRQYLAERKREKKGFFLSLNG